MAQNKYSFDGIILLKDGESQICPRNPGWNVEVEGTLQMNRKPKIEHQFLNCNKTCPFMKNAIKRENDKEGKPTGVEIKGVALYCMDKPIFFEIED
ncbi:MAG: hypothetical protein PHW73_00215 [Atribacterota bacterium]|nr:hypothetical protein [Atribacterota bacterium]